MNNQIVNTKSNKVCSRCQVEKPVGEFSKCKRYKDGLRYQCKICDKLNHLKHKKEQELFHKQWEIDNKEELRVTQAKYEKERRKTDLSFRIIKNVRARNKQAFKSQGVKKTMHTNELLGCTAKFFHDYMVSNFTPGMTEENNGKRKWVQHHPIELASVDLSDIEQLKKVCHYTNIIPMWEDEHKEWHRTHRFKTFKKK